MFLRELSSLGVILYRNRPNFGRFSSSREANRKHLNLSPFAKWQKTLHGVCTYTPESLIRSSNSHIILPSRVAQSVGHLTRKSGVLGSIPGLGTYPVCFPSADSRGAVVSKWRKYVHEVLVNCLGGLCLPRKSVVRLTDRPDMTLDVYRGRKTTTQQ